MIDVCALAAARPDSPAPIDAASSLSRDNAELIAMTEQMLAVAGAQGQLRSSELKQIQIAGRALVYGFARMNIDGHTSRAGALQTQ